MTNEIKHWLARGDCHGKFTWVTDLSRQFPKYMPEETAIIILGDAGVNYYLNKTDRKIKQKLEESGYTFYLVRGNHEQRPELVNGIVKTYDPATRNNIYIEPAFPHIRYFIDGEAYHLNSFYCLILGGAYSIDKYYRLATHSRWFPQEQLNQEEMNKISCKVEAQKYNFIMSHTSPLAWEPYDLFLSGIDQSQVDKTMEKWLDEIKDNCQWDIWLHGHFHADRIERPHVEQYFNNIEDLENIWNRWYNKKTFKEEYWLNKSARFYYDDNPYYAEVCKKEN